MADSSQLCQPISDRPRHYCLFLSSLHPFHLAPALRRHHRRRRAGLAGGIGAFCRKAGRGVSVPRTDVNIDPCLMPPHEQHVHQPADRPTADQPTRSTSSAECRFAGRAYTRPFQINNTCVSSTGSPPHRAPQAALDSDDFAATRPAPPRISSDYPSREDGLQVCATRRRS